MNSPNFKTKIGKTRLFGGSWCTPSWIEILKRATASTLYQMHSSVNIFRWQFQLVVYAWKFHMTARYGLRIENTEELQVLSRNYI